MPLAIIFDPGRFSAWRRGFQRKFRSGDDKLDAFDRFEMQVYQRFLQYKVPTIELKRQTPKNAVCQVCEKVNTGGVTPTVFELLTATYAADDYNLRKDWEERSERLRKHDPLSGLEATDFLTAVTLLPGTSDISSAIPLPAANVVTFWVSR